MGTSEALTQAQAEQFHALLALVVGSGKGTAHDVQTLLVLNGCATWQEKARAIEGVIDELLGFLRALGVWWPETYGEEGES